MGITPRILFAAHYLYMAVHIFMKTNRKRVVITGIGILSSLAENLQDFRNALLNKKNGVTDSVRFSKWFENARAAEVLHDIDYSELPDDVIASLDNAALWAYKVGKDALNQAGLAENKAHLKETGLIVGVSSAGTEAFLPLFEQRMEDFSLRKALFSGGFSSCCSSVSTLLGYRAVLNWSRPPVRPALTRSAWRLTTSRTAKAKPCWPSGQNLSTCPPSRAFMP